MPSGTNLSSESTSSWKYRSLLYERASPRDCMAAREPMPRYDLYCLPLMKISSPGLSSTPASKLPSITASAPTAIALAISPLYCRPPSPMTGTPAARHTCAASKIAVTWGTPTPVTTRVVQIEPGPTPTFTPSAPASIKACAPSRVAMLPPMMSTLTSRFNLLTISSTAAECPWAVSTTMMSTPTSTKVRARLYDSSPTPTAAATSNRPAASLEANGNWSRLVKSLTVMRPRNRPPSSTSGSFSTLCRRSRSSASSSETPTGAVTNGIGVMTSRTERARSVSNLMSRLVTMPTSTCLLYTSDAADDLLCVDLGG